MRLSFAKKDSVPYAAERLTSGTSIIAIKLARSVASCAMGATRVSACCATRLKSLSPRLATFANTLSSWAFTRRFEPCDCPRDPRQPDRAPHPRHFAGGANLIPGARKWQFLLAELGGAVAVLHGIAGWSWQSAWIVGGLAAIVAGEVRS